MLGRATRGFVAGRRGCVPTLLVKHAIACRSNDWYNLSFQVKYEILRITYSKQY